MLATNVELFYDVSRAHTDEPGFSTYHFFPSYQRVLKPTNANMEDVIGHIIAAPRYVPQDTGASAFSTVGGTWRELSEWGKEKYKHYAQADTRTGQYEIKTTNVFRRNESFFLRFVLQEPSQSDAQLYEFRFGGWRFEFTGPGASTALRWRLWHINPFFSSESYSELACEGVFLDKGLFFDDVWHVWVFPIGLQHLLLRTNKRLRVTRYGTEIYPVTSAENLVVGFDPSRTLARPPDPGDVVVFLPVSAMRLERVAGSQVEGHEFEITRPDPVHWILSGGAGVFAWRACGFASSFSALSPDVKLGYPKGKLATQSVGTVFRPMGIVDTVRWEWQPRFNTNASLTLLAADGVTPFSVGAGYDRFRYRIDGATPGTGFTPFLRGVKFTIPPTYGTTGAAVNFSDLACKRLVVRKSLQRGSDSMDLEFVDEDAATFYSRRAQVGRAFQFKESGTSHFIGRVTLPEYDHAGEHPKWTSSMPRLGAWQASQFRFAYEAEDFSGTDLAYFVNAVLAYAGITADKRTQVSGQVDNTGVLLPVGGGEPRYLPQPNTTGAEIIDNVMSEFAADWELLEDGNGNWSLNRRAVGASPQKIFYPTTQAARDAYGAGTDFQIFERGTLRERTDDAVNEYANDVWVLGVSYGEDRETGMGLVVGHDEEKRAWEDPTYEFYVGERRTLMVLNPSIPTTALAEKVARTMLHELHQFRSEETFRTDWDPDLTLGKRQRIIKRGSLSGGTTAVDVRLTAAEIETDAQTGRLESNWTVDKRFLTEASP